MAGQGSNWSSDERKFQIARVLLYSAFDNEFGKFAPDWMTLRGIGRAVGLKPSPYLRRLLTELRDENALEMRTGHAPNHALRFEYQLRADILETEKYHDRFQNYFREVGV